ncbi:hypothetical protein [Terasakiella pusilla]|uniref:hypothetical protein n=1 Tax=Terasakiella pusilla TaxID=64973 RepID=UPI003AA87212
MTFEEKKLGKTFKRPLRVVLLCSSILLSGCQTLGEGTSSSFFSTKTYAQDGPFYEISERDTSIQVLIKQSKAEIAKGNLEEASNYSNLALKLDITNPDLQFFNGYVYHLMGVRGDSSKFDLAEQGFQQALKFDPGNLAARYQLGLLYADQRRFGLAQSHFAAVATHLSDEPSVLYNLATSSYYARDPQTAEAALNRLFEVVSDPEKRADILRAGALSLAAMNEMAEAQKYIESYRELAADERDVSFLERRVQSWSSFYESDAEIIKAQYNSNPYGSSDPYGSSSSAYPNGSTSTSGGYGASDPYGSQGGMQQGGFAQTGTSAFADSSMVVVDVVLIGTQEDIRNSRGVNLLNGLQLQFGDPLTGAAGFGLSDRNVKDNLGNGLSEATRTITRSISIPAVTYSLNIANSLDADNQVLAKPSLVAQNGQTSEFFSGTEILAAAVSGGSGDSVSVQKEVGVKLSVKPEILPDDMIRLHVVAERTFLTDPSNSVVFEFRLDTTKTNVNSTVTMKFGETLILGGLSERETSKSSDGVPGLKDIPLLNYLFSQRVQREFERSILILLTPRRPDYTRQAQVDRDKVEEDLSDLERDLKRLEQRHGDWYTPRPTFSEIRDKIEGRAFFEEFRMGDLNVHSWHQDAQQPALFSQVEKRLLKR